MERLQKIIAASGLMSRRAAEKLISDGRVTVNGRVASLGDSADAERDEIAIDGNAIKKADKSVYIMLNKPVGYVTTMSDEFSRKTASELVSGAGYRVYPVGRLDMASQGLLLFTNDGDFANRLMHPSFEKVKRYEVCVSGAIENVPMLSEPMDIDGYRIRPAEVEIIEADKNRAELVISIHEGRNRQIRKMCSLAGLRVKSLKRVAVGRLELGELREGEWRYLTDEEVKSLTE
ncbi:MAG: rRNA pseudouridine synthase [Oscillospiraceae bacterium]|nr:rRNA pseudouridine synthase [Oscillospiraceae bacterium]